MKHTSGPWGIINGIQAPRSFETDAIMIEKDGAPIAIVTDNWIPEGQNGANAKLIAAAPKMLEMLLTVTMHLCRAYPNIKAQDEGNEQMLKKILELIKKATE